ncbi:putative quinol monooxygenase [Tersicoccus sp. MR15.9]|uniref:putative quinol monooxygenase n=1 Tax=Tersicoccus mangrovi TaxID=3121635 RepID=UPI002FE54229
MIVITVKFPVKPEYADQWPELSRSFTEATRAEPGNKWFDWSRSVENPNEYVLVEGFEDDAAGAHVNSPHFETMKAEFPQYLAATPTIISRQVDGDGWDEMGELQVG